MESEFHILYKSGLVLITIVRALGLNSYFDWVYLGVSVTSSCLSSTCFRINSVWVAQWRVCRHEHGRNPRTRHMSTMKPYAIPSPLSKLSRYLICLVWAC